MRALVTGASGFLGGALARRLREQGYAVVVLQRSPAPELEELGITVRRGDLADPRAVRDAAAACDVVFHVAAKAGHWGAYHEYYASNVLGTQAVIDACLAHGIRRLVYTSTPSVVHAGGDLEGIDESAPIATHFRAHYPATKAEAERRVLAANSATLSTVALRPHLIWGPGDRHLLPRIIARAKAGRLRFVGPPGKRIDTTWIDNAVDAHLAAAERLMPGAAHAGRAYFISNGEPIPAEDMINRLLDCAGLPPEHRRIPYPVAFAVGALMEAAWTLLRLRGEPWMTRFLAEQLATAHWYDISAAARDFGWRPRVSLEQGFARLKASWQAR
jgi:nucleoside-diphosphate-sugar epimerase